MSQILYSLIISDTQLLQTALDNIMSNNIEDYSLSLVTYPRSRLGEVDRDPDLIFIDNSQGMSTTDVQQIINAFPNKTYVVLQDDPEPHRRMFIRAGVDEVMSLSELQSDIGKHLLEKLMVWKALATAEEMVEKSEERFRDIIEHSHDMITLLDHDGTIIYNSPAFSRQMGYEAWEVLGKTIFDFVKPDEQEQLRDDFGAILAGTAEGGASLAFHFKRHDSQWRNIEATASNLLRNANVRAIVLNARDVTAEKLIEEELEKYRRHLEDLVAQRTAELEAALETERMIVNQQKTFISMVSHEFRTPLTIIDGNAQIIQSRGAQLDKGMLERRAGTIREGVTRLVRLIETILSEHVIDTGKLVLNIQPFSLSDLARQLIQEYREISPRHKIQIQASGACIVAADEKLIRHTLNNLLSNAVKYSPQAEDIDMSISQNDDQVVIMVKDRGLGIPKEEQSKLFGKYFRASTSGGIPGSGLGLNLVKQFVELHGGTVTLDSDMGKGTIVTVRMPSQPREKAVG